MVISWAPSFQRVRQSMPLPPNLARQMADFTEPWGKSSLETVWKRTSTFKRIFGKWLDRACVHHHCYSFQTNRWTPIGPNHWLFSRKRVAECVLGETHGEATSHLGSYRTQKEPKSIFWISCKESPQKALLFSLLQNIDHRRFKEAVLNYSIVTHSRPKCCSRDTP